MRVFRLPQRSIPRRLRLSEADFACIRRIQQGGTMELHIKEPLLALETGQVVTLDNAAGRRISAKEGLLWITEEGSRKDHIVRQGDAHIVRHAGRTVVQALKNAWVAIQ
jgi:hypothetical protein